MKWSEPKCHFNKPTQKWQFQRAVYWTNLMIEFIKATVVVTVVLKVNTLGNIAFLLYIVLLKASHNVILDSRS